MSRFRETGRHAMFGVVETIGFGQPYSVSCNVVNQETEKLYYT